MKHCIFIRFLLLLGFVLGQNFPSYGQAAGEFIIPAFRSDAGSRFTYWDYLSQVNGQGFNYQINNIPALGSGEDSEGNITNYGVGSSAGNVSFVQDGAANAFLTSSGAIYSYSLPTSFLMNYTQVATDPAVTNVVFQTQTGGTRFDLNNIQLEFTPVGGGVKVILPANFKALDEPLTGAFSERLVAAFQWDLTGLNVRDFQIRFGAPSSSMPLWQAQMDVTTGVPFEQALGFLLERFALPDVRFGTAGGIELNLDGAEGRFFLPGSVLELTGEPSNGFVHVGWKRNGIISMSSTYNLTFGAADDAIAAIFSPVSYAAWRNHFFNHSNTLTQTGPDNTTESVSGVAADPDKDGVKNMSEFAFGGNPYVADAPVVAPQVGLMEINGDYFPTITYRRLGASNNDLQLIYEVEWSTDMLTWSSNESGDPVTQELSSTLDDRGVKTVTAASLTPTRLHARQYFRVKATTL